VRRATGAATPQEGYDMIQNNPKFAEILNQIPFRHPAQLYEAFGYVIVFAVVFYLYWKTEARNKAGYLLGVFLVMLWTVRFIVEYVKESQGGIEEQLGLFSTGQWLSIPFIIIGLFLMFNAKKEVNSL